MPITKGKYRRATIDFTESENAELEAHISAIGCQKAKFVRAAVKFAIAAGLTTVSGPPPQIITRIEHRRFQDTEPPPRVEVRPPIPPKRKTV